MNGPVGLPQEMQYVKQFEDETQLFQKLTEEPWDLIAFFDAASRDRSWLAGHHSLVRSMLEWLTTQFFQDALLFEIAERAQKIIHAHVGALQELLPTDLALIHEQKRVLVNSLLFGTSSRIFYDELRRECIEKNEKTLTLAGGTPEAFEAVVEYLGTGQVEDLWKQDSRGILRILQEAAKWGVEGLVEFCAEIFKRYLTAENAVSVLVRSMEHRWNPLTERCIASINSREIGVRLQAVTHEALRLELYNYRYQAIDIFDRLKKYITQMAFHGDSVMDSRFLAILQETPRLEVLDLSRTEMPQGKETVLTLPQTVETLDLSMCEWVDAAQLEKIFEQTPHIRVLKLHRNVQLNDQCWVLLQQLRELERLEVAGCHQLSDEDLLLILRSCPRLSALDLSECKKLSDASFLEVSQSLQRLVELDVSKTLLSDEALIAFADRCKFLEKIHVSGCKNVTERGVSEVKKIAYRLVALVL